MLKLFSRRTKPKAKEIAPQLTPLERQSLSLPGIPPAGLTYATYDAMERDSIVQTGLTLKRLGVLASPWRLRINQNTPEARRNLAFAEENLARMDGSVNTILLQAMDAFSKGWSLQELVLEPSAGHVWIKAVRAKDPSLFGLNVNEFGTLESLTMQLQGKPALELDPEKFILYRHRHSYARPKGRSDLDAAYPHFVAKQALLAAWKVHLERYAMPTVLGSFQRGLPAEDQAAILSALQRLNENTAIVFPNEIKIDTLGGEKEGSTGFQEAIEFHNREMARAIVGQTLTTDEGRRVGSLALGKVHLQVLLLQLEALRKELADVVMTEQVLKPLIRWNFDDGPIPVFEFEPTAVAAFQSGKLE